MKVTIVVGGRWHAFDLALELETKGQRDTETRRHDNTHEHTSSPSPAKR